MGLHLHVIIKNINKRYLFRILISRIIFFYENCVTILMVPGKVYSRQHGLANRYRVSVSQMIMDRLNLNLSSCMTYHQVDNKSNMTGATSGARTAYPSRAPEFTLGFKWGSQELFTLPEHLSSPLVLSGVHRNCLPFQST